MFIAVQQLESNMGKSLEKLSEAGFDTAENDPSKKVCLPADPPTPHHPPPALD